MYNIYVYIYNINAYYYVHHAKYLLHVCVCDVKYYTCLIFVSFLLQWRHRWGVVTKLSPAAGKLPILILYYIIFMVVCTF